MPGGPTGRRQRPAAPEASSRAGGNGGASLFTPAYRVSHAAAGTRPTAQDRTGGSAMGGAGDSRGGTGQLPSAYSWAEADSDQASIGYQQPGYNGGSAWPVDSDASPGYSWADDQSGFGAGWSASGLPDRNAEPQVSNAVRGFPPAAGDPLPVYPPGPFAAWNRGPGDRARGSSRGTDRALSPSGARRPGPGDSSRQLAAATITPDEFDTDYSMTAIKDPVPGRAGRPGSGPATDRKPPASASQSRQRAARPPDRPAGKGKNKGKAAARPRGKRQPVRLAIGAAVVIVAAVATILVVTSPGAGLGSHPKTGSSPGKVAPSPTPPAGPWEYIGSRSTDQLPLSMRELYPASFTSAGVTYYKARQAKSSNCRAAIIGSALQDAVRNGKCTQAVRATYFSRSAKVMATIGVFNLSDSTLASKAALKASHSEFVAQLPSKSGPAHQIGQGTGIEEALVKGHYLVLVFAEATDLSAPKSAADRTRLESFMNLLIKRTANVSLSYRMVDGKPVLRG
ncbi:MAG TPA: hypothetical protein VF834_18215 [Streptosporangiaceae bacterium]